MDTNLYLPLFGGAALFLLAVICVVIFVRRRGKAKALEPSLPAAAEEASTPVRTPVLEPAPPSQLAAQLSKTRGGMFARMGKFFSRSGRDGLRDDEWAEIEEALLESDVGPRTVTALVEKVRERSRGPQAASLSELIREESENLLSGLEHGVPDLSSKPKPYVISVVGVNGVGKTTTIGKLGKFFQDQGRKVLMGAVDTFRPAAIQQLRVWSERVGCDFVTGREGADPGAVAFDSVTAGKARGADVVLLDTAGRLHTKTNLMEELAKVHRVVKKVIPDAPHETWLVVDGTLGQNSVNQAREFTKVLSLTGVIVTKLDGTAKGGAVLAIANELRLPIRFIGVGEQAADLIPFEPKPFVGAILGPA